MHNYPVPSKRYDIFQSAFEKRIAAIQAEVKKLDSFQGVYSAAREALIAVNLDNDVKLNLEVYGVYIVIHVKDDETMDNFHPVLDEIGNALVQRKLHSDGIPAETSYNGLDKEFIWNCRVGDKVCPLVLQLNVPWDGTNCIEIVKETKESVRQETIRRAVWHSRPYRESRED